jgi:hypothetical protein
MKGRQAAILAAILCIVSAATAGISWYFAEQALRRCMVDNTLQPSADLLKDNQRIIDSLIHDGLAASEPLLLNNYLQRIRQDGLPKYSAMKQRIDTLVNNNTIIVALLSNYTAHARTRAFKAAAEQYRSYATSFRDRWQSVFEIFMAGGNLPAAGPEYPAQFAIVLDQELRAD